MNAREYYNGKNRGLADAAANGNGAPDTTAIVPAGPTPLVQPTTPGVAAAPTDKKPMLWLAGAAAAGALLTWFVMRNKRGDD